MGKLKFAPDLFLELQELNRMQRLLDEDGYRKLLQQQATSFGLVRNRTIDPSFQNGQVELGTNSGTIKINEIFAIDKNVNYLRGVNQDNISITPDGQPRWIWIEYISTPVEVGNVSVSTEGNLTGVSTFFTDVIRGGRTFSSKITFPNSSFNTSEYTVIDVVSDTIAQLSGNFTPESNLRYAVVGTFTSGVVPDPNDKFPFQYDSVTLNIQQSPTQPTLTDGTQFLLARVVNDGGTITIQDYRSDFFQTSAETSFTKILGTSTNIAGVEAVKFDSGESTRTSNIVEFSWGFRGTSFTFNPSLRLVTIETGQGGIYTSTSDVQPDDFNNWRLYFNNNTTNQYFTVVDTVIQGSSVQLYLDGININTVALATEVLVVPTAEEVLVRVQSDPASNIDLVDETFTFPINQTVAPIRLLVYDDPTALYNITIAYKNVANYTPFMPLQNGSAYFENQFDSDGNLLLGASRTAYIAHPTNGFITLTKAPDAFTRVVGGDVLGVTNIPYNNLSPIYVLQPGATRVNVLFTTGDTSFSVGHIVVLRTQYGALNTPPETGATLFLQFTGAINAAGNTLQIREDYNNAGDAGRLIYNFTPTDFDYQRYERRTNTFRAYFDGSNWRVTHIEKDRYKLAQVVQFADVDLNEFDVTGLGRFNEAEGALGEWVGFALCNGQNGTEDLRQRFICGADLTNSGTIPTTDFDVGDYVAKASITLIIDNLPAHNHGVADTGHAHPLSMAEVAPSVTDPGHAHGFSPDSHTHTVTQTNSPWAARFSNIPSSVVGTTNPSVAGVSPIVGIDVDITTTLRTPAVLGTQLVTPTFDPTASSTLATGTVQSGFTGVSVDPFTPTGTATGATTGITINNTGNATPITVPDPSRVALAMLQRVATTI